MHRLGCLPTRAAGARRETAPTASLPLTADPGQLALAFERAFAAIYQDIVASVTSRTNSHSAALTTLTDGANAVRWIELALQCAGRNTESRVLNEVDRKTF
jgi:hypothetical protein